MGTDPIVLGVDLATAAVRVVAVDAGTGQVLATADTPLPAPETPRPGWVEQRPDHAAAALRSTAEVVAALGPRAAAVCALSVTGTSGTVVAADAAGRPVGPALLYSDDRGRALTAALAERTGARIGSAGTIGRLLWLAGQPETAPTPGRRYLHSADLVVAALTGEVVSDTSHALKAGIDPAAARWPALLADGGVPAGTLPALVHPGALIGTVLPDVAAGLGLPAGVLVVAGMTDGCTAQVAAGAVRPGQTMGVLGTTLVLKGVSDHRIDAGPVYSHLAPGGRWWPGGASNSGAGVLTATDDLPGLDAAALADGPSPLTAYPLPPPPRTGERFPFADPDAVGFLVDPRRPPGPPPSPVQRHRAELDGVAFVERLGLDRLAELGVASTDHRVAGGGSRSLPWLQVRASTLARPVARPRDPSSGVGAALLAATGWTATTRAGDLGDLLAEVVDRAVHPDLVVDPDPAEVPQLEEGYQRFLAELRRRDHLPASGAA
ncbi:FGGY-family carbohydrate kinase [Modestobacter sp. VKM Ac-2985]|uniref:FGGY-family carbohydrate kinase n=1 Tax=Modestobacter sp. VKM Ac-2985 TaxID=3004139 RepID=UPI0022AB55B8|nr:FGGY family carbohydrate kinase [Modestobacter sp. VKM Ac-2985]MCZ2837921.1 FGGY family carbohydrate kinase [Modestobacter sp. VKM Ac-2985]